MLLGAALPAFAQPVHLPVKVKHQWGFLEVTDETARLDEDRLYDHLGDLNLPWFERPGTRSGYYLVEQNGKLGLVTAAFEPVLAPAWREVHPISDQLFLVADAGGYTVVDREGRSLLGEERYRAIRLPGDPGLPYFLLRRDGKWGVVKQGQSDWVLPPAFRELAYLDVGDQGLWKVRPDTAASGRWRLLEAAGAPVAGLSGAYDRIEAAGRQHLALQEQQRISDWSIRDLAGEEVLVLGPEADIRPLNQHLFGYKEKDSPAYTVLAMRTPITPLVEKFDYLQAVDDELVFYRREGQAGFLQPNGSLLPVEVGREAVVAGIDGDLLRLTSRSADSAAVSWGLYAAEEKRLLLPFEYDSIAPFDGPFARVFQDGKVGLVNAVGEVIALPRFEEIPYLHPGMKAVYAYWQDSVRIFPVDQGGRSAGAATARQVSGITGPERYEWMDYGRRATEPAPALPHGAADATTEAAASYWQEVPLRISDDTLWLKEGQSYWQYVDDAFQLRVQEAAEITVRERSSSKKKKKKAPPPPKTTKVVTRWTDVGPPVKFLRRATPVDWTLAYHHYGGLAANELTVSGRNRFSARTISILRSSDLQVLDTPPMIGIRLADFAEDRTYAAFLDTDGKMGLIDREGRQAAGADGQPLRFTYIGKAANGLLPACDAAAPFSATQQPLATMLRDFNVEITEAGGNLDSEVRSDGPPRWGYIDPRGKTVIPFEYTYAAPFDGELAINQKGGQWGAINVENEVVIPFEYEAIRPEGGQWLVVKGTEAPTTVYYDDQGRRFDSEAPTRQSAGGQRLFPVQGPDGDYGYTDRDGLITIPFQFDAASPFSEGLATVRSGARWFFIDESGKEAFAIDTSIIGIIEVGQFSEGLCPIRKTTILNKKATRKWGYLDTKGRLAIPAVFDGAGPFQDGLAIVDSLNMADYRPGQTEGLPYEHGLIDQQGNAVTACEFQRIFPFNEAGFAEVIHASTGRRALIGRDGSVLTGKYYDKLQALGGGMAAFEGNGWRLFDYQGREIALPGTSITDINYFEGKDLFVKDGAGGWRHLALSDGEAETVQDGFQVLQPFEAGYAFARAKQQNRLYGRDGSWVLPERDQSFQFWSEGLIGVRSGNQSYYANLGGYNAFDRTFDAINRFGGGTALVQYQGKWGVVNRNGLFILPPKFELISREKEGYLKAQLTGRRYGLYAKDGQPIVPARYDALRYLPNGLIRVEYADFIGYYRQNGEALWGLEEE